MLKLTSPTVFPAVLPAGFSAAVAFIFLVALAGIAETASAQVCTDLDPQDDLSGQSIGIVMSEISPGNFIELFNQTGADIDLVNETFQLCSPFAYVGLETLSAGNSVVPAHGYLTIPWPTSFTDTSSGGQIILYSDNSFSTAASVMDFVCWGSNPHASRILLAISAGKSSGSCAVPLADGSLARIVMTDGLGAESYETEGAPSPLNCAPPTAVPALSAYGPSALVLLLCLCAVSLLASGSGVRRRS